MTWLRALLLALAALCAVSDAAAHASLLASTPADGAALRQAPLEVVLEFDEPVAPLVMRLIDDQGAPLALAGDVRAKGTMVRVPLPALRGGAFVFSYRVASADSHPVAGAIAFTIGEGIHLSRGAAAAVPWASGSEAMVIAARAVRDLLLLIASGAALFAVMVGAFPFQREVLCSTGFGAALASVAELCLQGAVLAGQDVSFHAAFRAAAASTAGLSSAAICGGAAAIALGAWAGNPARRKPLLLAGAIGAAAGVALTGHAASAQPSWLSMPLVACHSLVAAFWLGSLVALRLSMSMSIDTAGLARAMRRFSFIAMPAVAILVAAGTAFAAIQLDARDLRESPYGNLVVIKAALLVTLLVIAACNRFIMTPRLERGDAHAGVWLRRTITGELMLMTLVVVVTSVLSRTPPHTYAAITRELAGAASYSGSVTVSPARAGRNLVVVMLRDKNGAPLDAVEPSLVLVNRRSGIAPIERPLIPDAAGTFRHEGAELPFPGTWVLAVEGRVGDFEKFRLQAEIEIR